MHGTTIKKVKYNVYLLPSNTTTLIKGPGYKKLLYYTSFTQHVYITSSIQT